MHIFITGATGYIGGAVAARLLADGHRVSGLARSDARAAALEEKGVTPVRAELWDLGIVAGAARAANAVINAASAEDSPVAQLLVETLEGTGKPLIHTSGTSVVADRSLGEPGGRLFTEDMPMATLPERQLRVGIERIILEGAARGVRSVVIRPALVYGRGRGLNPHSHQVPHMVRVAREHGRPAHVGRGLNVWSNVHIDDVADLYACALGGAPAGSVFFCENGEACWREMAEAVGQAIGLAEEPVALSLEDSLRAFGIGAITSFGSNSRVSAEKARRMLGWKPSAGTIWDDLKTDYYRSL
jgi:nucleoside-diphosphate-sugar epimerase